MNFRLTSKEDLPTILRIIEDGRRFLKPQQSGQWQDGYPDEEALMNDIKNHFQYAILTEEGDIAAVASFTYHENDYDHLYEGKWISDYPYMVMHRISVSDEYRNKGYGHQLFVLFEIIAKEKGYKSIRIDTHENNKVMLHLIDKSGFIYCGKAILTPNKDRMVFEKILS